jgi:hypothetical protein
MPGVDDGRTGEPGTNQRLTVAQAAARLGITQGAVRSRIKRGTLPTAKEGGTVYVLLGGGASEANQTTNTNVPGDQFELLEALRGEIEHLRRESERKDTIIMTLSQANAEQAQTIRAIEAPSSPAKYLDDEEAGKSSARSGTRKGTERREDRPRRPRPTRIGATYPATHRRQSRAPGGAGG